MERQSFLQGAPMNEYQFGYVPYQSSRKKSAFFDSRFLSYGAHEFNQSTGYNIPPNGSTLKRLKERFGVLDLLTFAFGIFGILCVIVLLVLLWRWGFRVESHPSKNLLTTLALRDWLPQFTTILTAVLRFALGAHILTCCMMIASLALRRDAIQKPKDQHYVSVLQEAGPGPSALTLPLIRAAAHSRFVLGLLTLLSMLAVSTLSQFASTMLLSDFRPAQLFGEERHMLVNMTTGNFDIDNDLSKMGRPVEYPIFAERSEGRNEILSTGLDRGLMDSGNVSRAYMPISRENRMRVQDYSGFGTVLTLHTICFPPNMDNVTVIDLIRTGNIYNEPEGDDSSWEAKFALTGSIPPPESPLYADYRGGRSFNFDRLSTYNLTGAVMDDCPPFALYGVNICSLGTLPWDVIPEEGRSYDNTGDIDDPDVEWFLITRMYVPKEAQAQNLTRLLRNGQTNNFEGSEWLNQTFSDGNFSFTLSHSLCATRSIYTWANISAKAPTKNTTINEEPLALRSAHSNYSQDNSYDLSHIMRQMGVASPQLPTAEERGILLLLQDQDLRNRSGYTNASISISEIFSTSDDSGPAMCIPSKYRFHHEPKVYYYNLCKSTTAITDLIGQQLFLNTMTQSGSLALAFEALATFVFLTIYTPWSTRDSAINEGEPKYAVASFLEERLVPRRFVGFGIVMGLIVWHAVLVTYILRQFLRSGSFEPVEVAPGNGRRSSIVKERIRS
ncbi:hypothetical protein CC78DRAFT_541814 [Lojkania enalia]|uniref:Uncharacterized protein n=1 Tax=Lojkania enalia TaxID=147567 RepID=A0A9P4KFD1_9PLEO|nr:hypothetical protein CC78DRAFT_541814 [Didymosphaeria enalia]